MSLACPFCGQEIVVHAPKPGRFRMNCPACREPFALKVGEGPEFAMSAGPLPAAKAAEPVAVESATETVASQAGFDVLLARFRQAVAERWRWFVLALTHRKSVVGGALILTEFGRTSRGTVSRGRLLMLGRDATVRLMPADWGGTDVNSMAQSERIAYVSTAISHPNLLRRLDFSHDAKRRFAIEEAVEGPTLAAYAERPEFPGGDTALPLILQAARGLNAAHAQGLPHGDPTGENLWLDRGVVKLAGLGLAGTELAGMESADASGRYVQQDIQKLGQTLSLLARRGKGDVSLPSGLAGAVASKLQAGGTPDGYRDLNEAIRAIETILGLMPGGGFVASQAETDRIAEAADAYQQTPLGGLRVKLAAGFVAICVLFALIFAKAGAIAMMSAVLGLLLATSSYYSLIRAGLESRSGLFGKVRELMLNGRRADWLFLIAAKVIAIFALYFLGWLIDAIVLAIIALGFAIGFIIAFDLPITSYREVPLNDARRLLDQLRARGVSEYAIRDFVREHAGSYWEDLYEALFGLNDTRLAREFASGTQRTRFRFDAWRFPIIDWIDRRLQMRREGLARDRFARVEEVAGVARKINDMTARRRSKRIADALLVVAREVRNVSLAAHRPAGDAIHVTPRPIPSLIKEAVDTPEKLLTDAEADTPEARQNPIVPILLACVGSRVRFLLGTALIAGFLLWADQVQVISAEQIKNQATTAIQDQSTDALKNINIDTSRVHDTSEPLKLPGVPPSWTALIAGYGVGVAGLIMILSSFSASAKIIPFAFVGAAIAWFAPRLGLPAIGPLGPAALASAVGGAIFVVGLFVARR